jgi:hypothetical protein
MEFIITDLDKVLLIQTLYAHADARGLGRVEYTAKDFNGLLVSGIPIHECKELLQIAEEKEHRVRVVDYHNGKPIKLGFHFKRNGEIMTDSSAYDDRNGRYRFLEAILNIFNLDEIMITKKGYNEFLNEKFKTKGTMQPEATMIEFTYMLKNMKKVKDHRGTYWKFDTDVINYRPTFMKSS